ncbi:MAG: sn-glycerol-3-phosphate import ATP-binding protein UgpC [Rhizobium sp.]
MASISLKDITKVYGGTIKAIKDISLDVADGELLVLVGPSGCGKSTLLRMIAGLESITGGQLKIGNRLVNDVEPADRDIAMVFQNYALYPHMTVRDNLSYGLKNRNTPKPEIEQRIAEAAKILEIEPFLDRKPRQLSGGQRQRVAMGRAIVRKPAVFLFDEPLSNLDAKLRVQMRVEIKRLQRALRTTSVYVTHDQMEAMTLADRLVVLNGGVIEQIGKPIDLYEKPASTFVATFIGSPSMNLFQGRAENGKIGVDGAAAVAGIGSVNGKVTIGIRPEDLVIRTAGEEMAFQADVTVVAVELAGAESYVHATLGNGDPVIFRVAGRSEIEIGQVFPVGSPRPKLHIFDEAGRRVGD